LDSLKPVFEALLEAWPKFLLLAVILFVLSRILPSLINSPPLMSKILDFLGISTVAIITAVVSFSVVITILVLVGKACVPEITS